MPNRYTVHVIQDSEWQSYGEPLSSHATLGLAKQRAEEIADHHYYGVCIVDADTGKVDYGFGLDQAGPDEITEVVPDMEARVRAMHDGHSE